MKLPALVLLSIVAALSPPSSGGAQEAPEIHVYNHHSFLSTPGPHGTWRRVFYKACNHSNEESGFRWEGAGFGVTAWAQLQPRFCAYKNRYTEGEVSAAPKKVTFQGGPSGTVETYYVTNPDVASRVYSWIDAFVEGPDGFVALSAVSIRIQLEGDGSALINLVSSGEFDDVVIALPQSSLDIDNLRSIIEVKGANVGIEFDEFSGFRQDAAGDRDSLLTDDVRADTVSFRLRNPDGGQLDAELFVKDLAMFGSVIVMFGRTRGLMSMRNDILPPKAPPTSG